jgi:hypothetical protein
VSKVGLLFHVELSLSLRVGLLFHGELSLSLRVGLLFHGELSLSPLVATLSTHTLQLLATGAGFPVGALNP